MFSQHKIFMKDSEVAGLFGVSLSWVRGQRFKKNHGQDHIFNIEPVYIGSMPRYRQQDVFDWMENISGTNASPDNGCTVASKSEGMTK